MIFIAIVSPRGTALHTHVLTHESKAEAMHDAERCVPGSQSASMHTAAPLHGTGTGAEARRIPLGVRRAAREVRGGVCMGAEVELLSQRTGEHWRVVAIPARCNDSPTCDR